jgi:hypothetical protein
MATVADQKLVVDKKLKAAANSTTVTKKAQRNPVKPHSGRLTRSMTRGGYVKKSSQRAGSGACRSQTQKRVAEMLGLQLMPPSAPTTRQTRSTTREVHIRKVSSDHAAGNSEPQTHKRVGEMLGLFKTVPTKSTLYDEQASLIATSFQHNSVVNNRPITAEEQTRLLQLVSEDCANRPVIECQCEVHKKLTSIEPSFATHLQNITKSAARLCGKMMGGNLTNCAVQLLELVFNLDGKSDISVFSEGASTAAHGGSKVVYEIGIGEETLCVEATPDFYAETPDEYIYLLIGECQSSGSNDPTVQLAIATLGQFADERFIHPAKKLAACLFTKAKTASVFLGEELGTADEKIYVSFSKVNRECAFNLTSKDDIKGFAATMNGVIDLVLNK